MALKKFPIGVQDFAKIRTEGKYYVDKTDLVYQLTHTNDYYFLSRPRRFGKSLLVSTLECYFEGRRELFSGLAMERLETEWKKYPVLKISFAGNKYITEQDLADTLQNKLSEFEKTYGLPVERSHAWGVRLENILKAAYGKTGMQPVVLVDEYDAPLLDSMDKPELRLSLKEEIRKFFSPLKDMGGILRFVFLTGISKFCQLSIFSELNNLNVITMDDDYAAICGITKEELLAQMQPEIQSLADKNSLTYEGACAALQKKYDGYHFSKNSPDVYNPFSLINCLSKGELTNYWFATGTPTVLTKLVCSYKMDPEAFVEGFQADEEMFNAPTETATDPLPMLYQSGYLTIKRYNVGEFSPYILAFPNEEVKEGFTRSLLAYYGSQGTAYVTVASEIIKGFKIGDIDRVLEITKAYMSRIPYDAEKQNELHYKTVVYCLFLLITPYVVRCEEKSAAGRADIVVETADAVYVFEFKLNGNGSAEDALRQIDGKGYLIPYSAILAADGSSKKLYKIGVGFDAERRTIGEWVIR